MSVTFLTPMWYGNHAAMMLQEQRPSALVSGITIHVDSQVSTIRDRSVWPDESAPLLDVYLHGLTVGLVDLSSEIDRITMIVKASVWDAIGDVPDRQRRCPCCRKPYESMDQEDEDGWDRGPGPGAL